MARNYSEITPEIAKLAELCGGNSIIEPELYIQHKVNRGLRDLNGKGVLTGLTEVSEIKSTEVIDGVEHPCYGKLYYRGVDVEDLVKGFISDGRFGFEETVYLLLFGRLPAPKELEAFYKVLADASRFFCKRHYYESAEP